MLSFPKPDKSGNNKLPNPFRIGVTTHPDPDFTSPYFSACWAGLLTVFSESSLFFNPKGPSVDGWILLAPDDSSLAKIRKEGKPAIVVNGVADFCPSIDLDNVSAAREVTEHLMEQGHRRIGFIDGKVETSNALDRREGYRRALEKAGIPWDADLVNVGRFERAGGRKAMIQFLKRAFPPTAVFAANDHMALGAWDVLKEKKIPVPGGMALAGFDDIPEAQTAGLTSVGQPLEDMARRAATWLLDWIKTNHRPEHGPVLVEGKLVKRSSTGEKAARQTS